MAKKNIYYLFHKEGGREITNSGELKLINQSQDLCERLNDTDYDTVTKMCCDAHNSGLSKGITVGIVAMGVGYVVWAILEECSKNKKKRAKQIDEMDKEIDEILKKYDKTEE